MGAPNAAVSRNRADAAWYEYKQGGKPYSPDTVQFVQGKARKVDPIKKVLEFSPYPNSTTAAAETIHYDYIVVATGVRRQHPVVPNALTRQQYLSEYDDLREQMSAATDGVVIVGGG